jgi:hypothetical protein
LYRHRRAKFFNNKTDFKGRLYNSKGEAGLAKELDILLKAGKFIKVDPQVTFNLYGVNGGKVCTHRVDFVATLKDGAQEVYEYKGFATPVWQIKLKLFVDNYPAIQYVVVTAKEWKYYGKKRKH